jgi:Cd2+/Zn2+-exporting ATPase
VVVVGTEKEAFGMIAIQDSVRKEAADALGELRSLGATDLAMLTGDNPETGKAVASLLPMDAVHAGLLPEQKIALVREAVEKGEKVAMVGDGINDAPALAQATVGVVMGAAGTDVAMEAGDVVLMGDDLRKIPFAVRLGRRTLRIIRFNVVFSLASKAVFLVLAPLGFLVVGNSMRLLAGSNGSRTNNGGAARAKKGG